MTLFEANQTTRELAARISAFMEEHVYPAEPAFLKEAEESGPWAVYPTV
jgi:acyl-CoA dehydrogenase